MKAATYLFSSTIICNSLFGTILLDDVMSKDIQRQTGVANLNARQKATLEHWINDTFILKTQLSTPSVLSLSENLDGGKRIRLNNGALYEIAPEDQNITALWITPIPIMVTTGGRTDYPFKLINQNNNQSVSARRVSN